jgi:BRCT domain type II-containing protein
MPSDFDEPLEELEELILDLPTDLGDFAYAEKAQLVKNKAALILATLRAYV